VTPEEVCEVEDELDDLLVALLVVSKQHLQSLVAIYEAQEPLEQLDICCPELLEQQLDDVKLLAEDLFLYFNFRERCVLVVPLVLCLVSGGVGQGARRRLVVEEADVADDVEWGLELLDLLLVLLKELGLHLSDPFLLRMPSQVALTLALAAPVLVR
jgi:hypothetical protein